MAMARPALGLLVVTSLAIGLSLAEQGKADLHQIQRRASSDIATETRDAYDPCLNSRHIEINDPRRSTLVRPKLYPLALDDGSFPVYWYRFTSGAGGVIPTNPPNVGFCGTVWPVWHDGTIPEDDDNSHETSMCQTNGITPRHECWEAEIKNCTDYMVYKLPSPKNVKSAYCAGSGVPCEEGQTSPSGFTPCEHIANVPAIPRAPEVKLNETDEMYFYLECHLNQPDPDAVHDVQWIADGNIFFRQTLSAGETFGQLKEDAMRFRKRTIVGYHVRCEVSARKVDRSIGSKFTRSRGDGFFLGIKFVDVNGNEVREIVVLEDDKAPSVLYLQPTAPIRCNAPSYLGLPDFLRGPCSISVKVRNGDLEEFAAQLVGKCTREKEVSVKDLASQIEFAQCRVTIGVENWKEHSQHRILINAIQDKIFDGQQSRYIDLDVQAQSQEVWDQYDPPYVKVTIKDTEVPSAGVTRCKSLNDPHMTTFDQLNYENMNVGEFVLYENIEYNFRVHAYFIKCNGDIASCNCGVAAQAGDDVILFDRCNKFGDIVFGDIPEAAKQKGFLRTKVLPRGVMTPGFTLEHTAGTNSYVIKFPHSAELHISVGTAGTEHINLEMVPSQEDYAAPGEKEKVRGLCGTYSKDVTDDFLQYQGGVYQLAPTDTRNNRIYPDTFSNSWKIEQNDSRSMYNGQIDDVREYNGHKMCACLRVNDIDMAVCAFGSECREEEDLTDLTSDRTENRRRRRDAGHDHVRDFDDGAFTFNPGQQTDTMPEERWPTPSGMSKRAARAFCDALIKNAPFYDKCKDLSGVDLQEHVETCVTDIGLVGSTDFAVGIREAAENKCKERITADMSQWTKNDQFELYDPERLVKFKSLRTAAGAAGGILGSKVAPDPNGFVDGRPLMTIRHSSVQGDGVNTFVPNPAIVDTICPESCHGRGRCMQGKCVCNQGWAGKTCAFEDGPPEVYMVPLGGLCDKQQRPCRSTPVLGRNFIESADLSCIFKRIGENSATVVTKPEFESYMEVHCPIPAIFTPFQLFELKVSNYRSDASKSSAALRLAVYNSACASCTLQGCTAKPC